MKLPPPSLKGRKSLEETLALRRSRRRFDPRSLNWKQISQLLWAAQGITDESRGFRTAPSAGALWPLQVYFVIEDGAYHYRPEAHEAEKIVEGDLRAELKRAALAQPWVLEAPLDIVLTAVYEGPVAVYGERGGPFIDMEAGHVAQNVHLQAVALGLGSVPVGAFTHQEVRRVLQLPEDHEPVYIISVGYVQ